jgi:hypothetical protein
MNQQHMDIHRDSSQQPYVEVPMGNGEFLRVTYLREGWPAEPAVRVQVRTPGKPPRQGPEFPVRLVGEVVQGILELARHEGESER